jgi:HigB_toxin, RelE-like toxic component of a toxin-antitoxin system
MKLLGRKHISPLRSLSLETDRWVNAWLSEVLQAHWKNLNEVIHQYPSVTVDSQGEVLFCIPNHSIRIRATFCFTQGIAIVTGIHETK